MSRRPGPLTTGLVLMLRYKAKRYEVALTKEDPDLIRHARHDFMDSFNPDVAVALIDHWLSRKTNGA